MADAARRASHGDDSLARRAAHAARRAGDGAERHDRQHRPPGLPSGRHPSDQQRRTRSRGSEPLEARRREGWILFRKPAPLGAAFGHDGTTVSLRRLTRIHGLLHRIQPSRRRGDSIGTSASGRRVVACPERNHGFATDGRSEARRFAFSANAGRASRFRGATCHSSSSADSRQGYWAVTDSG